MVFYATFPPSNDITEFTKSGIIKLLKNDLYHGLNCHVTSTLFYRKLEAFL